MKRLDREIHCPGKQGGMRGGKTEGMTRKNDEEEGMSDDERAVIDASMGVDSKLTTQYSSKKY